jgi:antitoxin Phd
MREIQRKTPRRSSPDPSTTRSGRGIVITRRGHKEAVVVSWERPRRLSNVPSFGRLLAAAPLDDEKIAPRDRSPPRRSGL